MPTTEILSRTGDVLDIAKLQSFHAGLRGTLLLPGSDEYETARRVHNAMVDKRPGLIVRCAVAADVVRAVNFASENALLLAVRGGGHSVAGLGVCEGGMVIDLSRMKGIRLDPAGRTLRAEAGVRWGELDQEAQVFGLGTTGGAVSTTGIAGLTLGGGLGVLMRKHGLACDNVLSIDVVTADGALLKASSKENVDLFWALRGGGGNFGIVTTFEYRLHPVGTVVGGLVLYPFDRATEMLAFYRELTETAPDELTAYAALLRTPDGVRASAIFSCYAGPLSTGETVLRPLREFGPPMADLIGPLPYAAIQETFDPTAPPGLLNYWKSRFVRDLSTETIDELVAAFPTAPSPLSSVVVEHLGAAVGRVAEGDTAFSHRSARYNVTAASLWRDSGQSEQNISWARQLWDALRTPAGDAVYANYLSDDEGDQRLRAAYGANYERLVAAKNRYDPTNLFRVNQNIKPTLDRAAT